jgi:DNA repair exonuclease SbcCD ATPase subunit
MRVTRLKIQDFGRHKLLDKSIDVPVVGLMGANGTGKSTILEAIELAFTGGLKDKQETYVRNAFLPEDPSGTPNPDKPANGKVTVWFRKDGKEGELFRQVGKTAKRHLKWEGETYTSASDVEAKLKELFDADKEARSNAIFPPQGSLDKLLFGTPTERLELFTKLLLVGYMGRITDAAAKQASVLMSQVQDYTTLLTEIKTQHALAEDQLAKLEGEKARSYDWSADYQYFRDLRGSMSDMRGLDQRVKELADQIQTHRTTMEMTVEAIGKILGLQHARMEDVIVGVEQLEYDIDFLTKKIAEGEIIGLLRDQRSQIALRRAEIKNTQAQLELRRTNTRDYGKEIQELETQLAQAADRDRLLQDLDHNFLPKLKSIQGLLKGEESDGHFELPSYGKSYKRMPTLPGVEESDIVATEIREITLREKQILTKGKLEALQALVKAGDKDTTRCPVCGQGAAGEGNDWLLKLKIAEKEFTVVSVELAETSAKVKDWRSVSNYIVRATEYLQDKAVEYRDHIFDLQRRISLIPDVDTAVLKEQLDNVRAEEQKYLSAVSQIENLKLEDSTLEGVLNSATAADLEAIHNFDLDVLDHARTELTMLAQRRQDIRLGNPDDKVLDLMRSAEQSISVTERDALQVEARRAELAQLIATRWSALSAQTLRILEESGTDYDVALDTLQTKARAYNELAGEVKQAKDHADKLQARRNEIELQIERDRERQRIISDLKTLEHAFNKKGIPQAYIQYVFENLTPMAQENLNMLGADFVIEPDPTDVVTVRFMKLTDDSSGWMPQNKLSGGQKVRVSIAYLLAVQQLIIPDIAFLVLDEPSTHIDDDGIDSMKELFSALGSQLQHTEAQVIVCDHKPELQTSFQETITLQT